MNRFNDLKRPLLNNNPASLEEGNSYNDEESDNYNNDDDSNFTNFGRGVGGASIGSIKEFYQIVLVIKTSLSSLQVKTYQLRKIFNNIHSAQSEAQEQQEAAGILEITKVGNKCAKSIQALLKETKSESDKLERKDPMGPGSPESRIRRNLLQVLTKKYVDQLKDYQDAQNSCRELRIKRARLHVLEAKPNATPEQVDELVRTGATGLVEKTILLGNANIAVEQALSDVTTQYREVLRLEESVNELSELFIDLAILIEQQGVLLDTIESNVKVAGGYVDEGNNQLGKAIISLRNRRKCCCYICTVIVIIIGIVALVIYIKLSN